MQSYELCGDISLDRIDIVFSHTFLGGKSLENDTLPENLTSFLDNTNLKGIETVNVDHCLQSFGIVIDHATQGKIVYVFCYLLRLFLICKGSLVTADQVASSQWQARTDRS